MAELEEFHHTFVVEKDGWSQALEEGLGYMEFGVAETPSVRRERK